MSLEVLPKELIIKICVFLKWEFCVKKLCFVSISFYSIIDDDVGFWKEMCYVRYSKNHDLENLYKQTIDSSSRSGKKKKKKKKKKRVLRSYKDEYHPNKTPKMNKIEKDWNPWKKIFIKFQFPGWKKFVRRLTQRVEELRKMSIKNRQEFEKKVRKLYCNDIVCFCSLDCSTCRELGTSVCSWGDFQTSFYFFPKQIQLENIGGEDGFSQFIERKKNLGDMEIIEKSIIEDFKNMIQKEKIKHEQLLQRSIRNKNKKKNEKVDDEDEYYGKICARVAKELEKKYAEYVDFYGLEFNKPRLGECRFQKLILKKKNALPQNIQETIEEFEKNNINVNKKEEDNNMIVLMKDFEDFVFKSMVYLRCHRVNSYFEEFLVSFQARPTWENILSRLGSGMGDGRNVLPMYSKTVINALFIRNTGNERFICAEGKNGYYLLAMWTS